MCALLSRRAALVVLIIMLASAAMAHAEQFIGVVTGDRVNVRAGAGLNDYVVLKLNKGDLVTVHKRLYVWYAVAPPAGSFSYIHKDFVKIDQNVDDHPDEPNGTVTGSQVRVRAPAPIGPEKSYAPQLLLNKGDRVRVIGSERDFLKIVPPDAARLFIHTDFVRPATQADIDAAKARAADPSPNPDQPAPDFPTGVQPAVDPPTTQPASTTPPTTQPSTSISVGLGPTATQPPTTQPALVPIQPRSLSLTELEAKFHEVSALPIDQQPLNELTAAYTALKATKLHEADLAIVDVRLHILAARRELLESIRLIADARRQLQQQRDQAAAPPQVVAKPKAYTAVGLLFASTLYTGDVLPHLYRLVEPLSGLTIAYVEPSDAADLRPMLGRLVGVVGKARSDPALRLRVVAVETADVLSAQPIPATVGVSTDLPTD